jgi:hypothetical protein
MSKLETMPVFNHIEDGSHGWLQVPTKILREFGIFHVISRFSFFDPIGHTAFLEEDFDANMFLAKFQQVYGMRPATRVLYRERIRDLLETLERFPDTESDELYNHI